VTGKLNALFWSEAPNGLQSYLAVAPGYFQSLAILNDECSPRPATCSLLDSNFPSSKDQMGLMT
jgi:hypothetical protein